jgi:DNA-binding beta-propeller fold protein YncE
MTLAFDGTRIWVANQGDGTVSILSASDGSLVRRFPVMGTPFAIASAGTTTWIAISDPGGSGGHFTAVDSLGTVIRTLVVQEQPIALISLQAADLPEPLLYFVSANSDKLFRFDPDTGYVTAIGSVGGVTAEGLGPQALLFDGTNIWVSNAANNLVVKMDLNGVVEGAFPVGQLPGEMAFDGSSLWVANFSNNTVSKLRVSDGQVLQAISTGTNPAYIAFDGVDVWVTNMGSNTLTQIRASDGMVLGTHAVGQMPAGVVFDGAQLWVANSGSNTVTRYVPGAPS